MPKVVVQWEPLGIVCLDVDMPDPRNNLLNLWFEPVHLAAQSFYDVLAFRSQTKILITQVMYVVNDMQHNQIIQYHN